MAPAKSKNIIVLGLITFGIVMRVLPYVLARFNVIDLADPSTYAWNVSPVPAMCLLGGAYLSSRWGGLAVGLIAYLASDLLIAGVSGQPAFAFYNSLPFVYAGFILHGLIGTSLRSKAGPVRVGLTAVASELAFFLLTNFGEWAVGSTHYAKTPAGLLTCYAAALPFLYRSIYGTLIYSAIFFEVARAVERQTNGANLVPAPVPNDKR